ncbi:molecular chaperone HtpG [Anaerococcus sp.]|uniref:molecular chaperone HtpG n=1 Tax=Anaerococcus sp. TaxID=1872515 RepID=UPI0025853EC5|nr:molecular chaperone HtpG [Anaerococcus sp.]MDU1828181.1 molecular chaperone HtpG [Anaerococcus sp.]MDU1864881.1 molecular chaperone HtpG [Anaerococcus sp.]MDU3211972.1 molecular chaperone HtpG [Anaerococcus sp.]
MKQEFKAEAKKVMDLMINSIYTNKEIFLRELISNSSDALDKLYYKDLKSDNETNKDDYYIELIPNKDERSLTIVDTGIGMNESDLIENLGTIAKSGTENFKNSVENSDIKDLIGQFGVGFYSAFMVADKVEVRTKKYGEDTAYLWQSENADGFEITEIEKKDQGTEIKLFLKENTEDENYDGYLDQYRIENLVNKYSNYIRYPIKMEVTKSRLAEDSTEDDPKYEEYKELDVLNSDTPIWKKNKNDLSDEDYINFYQDQHFGFDEPLSWLHFNVEGAVEFRAIIYIPKKAPFDYYSKDYQKGLQLYTHGVKIMDRSEDLLEDAYSFAKGVVESDDLTLNISRETLQQDRQLRVISKQINKRINSHLLNIKEKEPEKYEEFFNEFGNNIKMAIYESYGANKGELQDLLLFKTRKEDKMISLRDYKENMKSTDEDILYATGDSIEKIKSSPALNMVDKDRDVILLDQPIDEFLIRMLDEYEGLKFKSISEEDEASEENSDSKDLVEKLLESLPDDVVDIKFTDKLEDIPSMIKQRGEISIEMEKALKNQPNAPEIKAEKILEINKNSKAYELLNNAKDDDKKSEIASILLDQAKLIEGLDIKDPVTYTKNIWKLI